MEDKSVHKFGQFNEHIEVLSADDEPVQGPHRRGTGCAVHKSTYHTLCIGNFHYHPLSIKHFQTTGHL